MDVVKRQTGVLRGSLHVSSEAGQGTRVSLTLPLTLAIIDGRLIEAGVNQYILPMAAVAEFSQFSPAQPDGQCV
jgi:two-component system chemotaxis sensor kinase CheA